METAIVYHKYSFRGEMRTYRNKLKLVGEGVDYLGQTPVYINHWDVGLIGRINEFLESGKVSTTKPKKPLYKYRVDGEDRYYDSPKDRNDFDFVNHKSVEYLGIKFGIPTVNHKSDPKYKRECCYCETRLDYKTYTRDHLIPRSRGGKGDKKNLRPCCNKCNTEKGSLMLHSYIQLLNLKLMDVTGDDLKKLQTKITNANKLAIEISNDLS